MLDSLESQQSWDTRNLAMSSFSQLSGDEELSSLSLSPELRSQSLPPLSWHWADTVLRCVYGADEVNKCHLFSSLSPFQKGI